jgi:hypothetical protein
VSALSTRPAWAVIALATVSAVPIGWHAVTAPTMDSCRDAEALFASESIGEGLVTDRWPPLPGPPDVRRIGGQVAPPTPDVGPMKFRISRSFVPSTYYGDSEVHDLDTSFGHGDPGRLVEIEAGGVSLPVYWLEDTFEANFRVRAYFTVFDGRPVARVLPAAVAAAGRQLLRGTRPVTLFAFRAEGRALASDAMRGAARDWLRAAWIRHQEVCAPSAREGGSNGGTD